MKRDDFKYTLPPQLIAQTPLANRSASRLLVLGAGVEDRLFADLPQLLQSGDLLVFNDTRVLPARVAGRKGTGGRIEVFLERITAERRALVQIRASRSPKPGQPLELDGGATARVCEREDDLFEIELDRDALEFFQTHGSVPLPPYIEREAADADAASYQTVFARHPGAVAAPTAGLHFDEATLEALGKRGIDSAFITLHVGAGTFSPMREDDIDKVRLHSERVSVGAEACDKIQRTKAQGGRVVAVGTTVVRSLESAAAGGALAPWQGETTLFIRPGFEFRVVDRLLTNFHLPESSLLVLVSAFAGRERVLDAYRHAVDERYRFFSYGDAMLVDPMLVDPMLVGPMLVGPTQEDSDAV